jgi:hypothetical protein
MYTRQDSVISLKSRGIVKQQKTYFLVRNKNLFTMPSLLLLAIDWFPLLAALST